LLNPPRPESVLVTLARAQNPYPAKPSAENCARCPFTAICRDSVLIKREGSYDDSAIREVL
jgi:hypothetical protein